MPRWTLSSRHSGSRLTWKTTGLTDASVPVPLSPAEIKQGASNVVRLRTIQARVPTIRGRSGERVNFVFDCDKLSPDLLEEVARAILSRRMFIAHNAGFDLYWLRRAEGRKTMPSMVVDTMLMTRLLRPELVLKRTELVENIRHINEVPMASPVEQAAWKSLISGASGGSLADVVLALFGVVVDKTFQKPHTGRAFSASGITTTRMTIRYGRTAFWQSCSA